MIEDYPWAGVLIGLAAMAPFAVQAYLFVAMRRQQRSWVHTTAVVVHTRVSTTRDNVESFHASYTFADVQGRAQMGRGEIDHEAGNGVELSIIYNPENPAVSQPWHPPNFSHWIAGSLGFLLFLAGAFGVVSSVHIMVTGRMLGE